MVFPRCTYSSSSGLALNNKFLPVHCVVTRDQCPASVLHDGFVILPSQTKFHEMTNVILQKLEGDIGHLDDDEHVNGEVLIKNWNPLPIDTVTDNPSTTVQEILGDLMNLAVLRIHISKFSNGSRSTVYESNPTTLDYDQIDEEGEEEDEEHQPSPNGYSSNSNTNDGDNTPLNLSKKLSSRSMSHHPNASTSRYSLSSSSNYLPLHSDSHVSANNRRQRERTTFDPLEETPRLFQIFTDTKHPTRYQIASICETLNALPCRKGKKALEPYNIQYWFKNARAALKRKKHNLVPSDLDNGQEMTEKTEFDSSDDDEDDEQIDDDQPSQETTTKTNYYSNYLQAFDISFPDPSKQSQMHSEDSHDGSVISEQSPSISYPSSHLPTKLPQFDYSRTRRNRIFIDPSSEVPKLEQWFAIETHPDHILIERICSELNQGEYRTKFPKLESKHIRLWFKNHRAKVKRLGRVHQTSTHSNGDETKNLRLSSSTIDDN